MNIIKLTPSRGRPVRAGLCLLGGSALAWSARRLLALLVVATFLGLHHAGLGGALPVAFASGKSDHLENALLDHVFGGGNYTRPANVYFALFSAAPTDAGGGTELTGNNYARVEVANNNTNFPAASGGAKTNGTDIRFPVLSGTTPTVLAWGVFDAASGGNLLYWGDLAAGDQKAYAANDRPVIEAGQLQITED